MVGLRDAFGWHVLRNYSGPVVSVCRSPVGEFEKRVAIALNMGLFHFSQLIAGFEVLLLERKKLSPEAEHTLLSIEKKTVHLDDRIRHFVEVPKFDRGAAEGGGSIDGRQGGADDGNVHGDISDEVVKNE